MQDAGCRYFSFSKFVEVVDWFRRLLYLWGFFPSGFKAGSEDFKLRKGVCVKTHFYGENHIPNFDNGAILLLRNPYYSLVSEFMRFYSRLRNVSMPEIIRSMRNRDGECTSEGTVFC